MRLIPVLLVATVAGFFAAGAGAAPTATSGVADLCSVSKSVASSITHSGVTPTPTAGTSIATLGKQLKAAYTRIRNVEPVVLAQAPSSLKPHFQKVFAYDNMIYDALSKAHWDLLAFARNAKSLEAGAVRIRPDLRAIEAYFAKCKP